MNSSSEVLGNSAMVQADQVFDALEQSSRTEPSPTRFYAQLFQGVSVLLGAKQACIFAALERNRWCPVASTQDHHAEIAEDRLQQMASNQGTSLLPRWCEWKEDGVLLGCSAEATNWSWGGMVVEIARSTLPTDPSTPEFLAAISEKMELLQAFAELAHAYPRTHRCMQDNQHLLQSRSISKSLWESRSQQDSNRILLDGLRCLMDADRVTLFRKKSPSYASDFIAVSDNPSRHADTVLATAIKHLDETPFSNFPNRQPLEKFAKAMEAAVAVALAVETIPNTEVKLATSAANHFLILEWMDRDRSCAAIPHIASVTPWILDAWTAKKFDRPRFHFRSAAGILLAACVLIGMVLYFLIPTELTIQATGTLQPIQQTLIFAPSDGFVDSVPVSDGQLVQKNEPVAVLSSPSLQLQLNQIDAEIALVQQRSEGLNISLNQIRPNQEQADTLSSRLAGEIAELDTKRTNLVQQRALIEREIARLELLSPLEGTIIGWQMDMVLESRPVKRGDMLLRIAKLDGDWQMESRVPDWESGYVMDAISNALKANTKLTAEYALVSEVGNRGKGHFVRASHSVFTQPEGQFLSVIFVPESPLKNPRLGASVTVSIPCGRHPRWFVWSRSMIDAAYRRFWL